MNAAKRRTYDELGRFLKAARKRLRDPDTKRIPSPAVMAKHLKVSVGFIYQVEQGIRKPKDGYIGKWASVYGARYADVWRCLDRVPMDLVASLREEPKPSPTDSFSQLTNDEMFELLPFLDYVQWKIAQRTSKSRSSGSI